MAFASLLRSARRTHTKRQGTRAPAATFCVRSAAGAAAERCFPASPSPRSSQVDASPPRSWPTTIVQSALAVCALGEPRKPLVWIASVSQRRDHRRAPLPDSSARLAGVALELEAYLRVWQAMHADSAVDILAPAERAG